MKTEWDLKKRLCVLFIYRRGSGLHIKLDGSILLSSNLTRRQ